jgi:hypothetical protein
VPGSLCAAGIPHRGMLGLGAGLPAISGAYSQHRRAAFQASNSHICMMHLSHLCFAATLSWPCFASSIACLPVGLPACRPACLPAHRLTGPPTAALPHSLPPLLALALAGSQDRLPTPFGLVRSGVAPDHQDTKVRCGAVWWGANTQEEVRSADSSGTPGAGADAWGAGSTAVVLPMATQLPGRLMCMTSDSGIQQPAPNSVGPKVSARR